MIAILSDIHGNLAALEAVITDAKARGCTRFISLGDIAGYGPQPGECINVLQALSAVNILGNHDSYIIRNENCPRSRVVSQLIEFQRSILNGQQVAWLRKSLSELREGGLFFVHGGPDDPCDQYLYTITKGMIPQRVRWLFSGHTHVQLIVDYDTCGYCNPGSVGQPRDGDPRAAYAVMSKNKIVLHRVDYDIDRTVEAMKAFGFESFLYENLYRGTQIGGRVDEIKVIPV